MAVAATREGGSRHCCQIATALPPGEINIAMRRAAILGQEVRGLSVAAVPLKVSRAVWRRDWANAGRHEDWLDLDDELTRRGEPAANWSPTLSRRDQAVALRQAERGGEPIRAAKDRGA